MAKPIAVVTSTTPAGLPIYNAFDLGAPNVSAAIGGALISQLATADLGHIYTITVVVYDQVN